MLYTGGTQFFIPVKTKDDIFRWRQTNRTAIIYDQPDVHFIVGKSSMFEVFEEIKKILNSLQPATPKLAKDDISCVFMHDDCHLLCGEEYFDDIIELLEEDNVGFLGVAGTSRLKRSGIWWDGFQNSNPNDPRTTTRGMIYHGESMRNMAPTYYGHPGPAEVIDGVFMAFKQSTLEKLSLAKPKDFEGNWDFYDIYYSFQATANKLTNFVVPLPVLHESKGEGALEEGWKKNKEAFVKKFGQFLG